MSGKSYKPLVVIAVCLSLGYYLFLVTRGTGPMPPLSAERLLEQTLRDKQERTFDAVAPDGEKVEVSVSLLGRINAIDCPRLSTHYGRAGKFREPLYGGASFPCLFRSESRSGAELHFSATVRRTADPDQQGLHDGETLSLQSAAETLELMRQLGNQTRRFSTEEQAELWARLADDDIYVPADKSRKSPTQKAFEKHMQRLFSQQ